MIKDSFMEFYFNNKEKTGRRTQWNVFSKHICLFNPVVFEFDPINVELFKDKKLLLILNNRKLITFKWFPSNFSFAFNDFSYFFYKSIILRLKPIRNIYCSIFVVIVTFIQFLNNCTAIKIRKSNKLLDQNGCYGSFLFFEYLYLEFQENHIHYLIQYPKLRVKYFRSHRACMEKFQEFPIEINRVSYVIPWMQVEILFLTCTLGTGVISGFMSNCNSSFFFLCLSTLTVLNLPNRLFSWAAACFISFRQINLFVLVLIYFYLKLNQFVEDLLPIKLYFNTNFVSNYHDFFYWRCLPH